MIHNKETLDISRIGYAMQLARAGKEDIIRELMADIVCVNHKESLSAAKLSAATVCTSYCR